MKQLHYRAEAVADLRRIARDTRAAWGEDQAAKYISQLRDDVKSLREFTLRFPEVISRPGMRRMNSGKHAVLYLVSEDRVEVVRVLHVARDFEQWV
ncbi:MAG: type II toxin-antitoxin system RelE/ParE family toxin [Erythrobacter sp.]